MAYEIDFVGVGSDKCTKDADAICLRWKNGISEPDKQLYTVGVVDGGFDVHGDTMVKHMNRYYFDDMENEKSADKKIVDFMVVTHPDQDHTIGLKRILESFTVKKIYMNRPWLYVDDLFNKVNDGRITKDSLYRRLRGKYNTVAEIEDIAQEQDIPIYEVFEGTFIERNLLILSPSKNFYLSMLIESEKTPLQENAETREDGLSYRFIRTAKTHVLDLLETWDNETLREGEHTSAENETSVVMRGIVDGSGFFLTGDAGIRALTNAIDYMDSIGEDILNDISFFQIPHHGGRHNVSPSVLDRMLGEKVPKGVVTNKDAIASAAKDSDHPLKMVTNAFIRRGVRTYKTAGNVICHHDGEMPKRYWGPLTEIEYSDYVEKWSD